MEKRMLIMRSIVIMTLALGLFLGGCSEIGQQDSGITSSTSASAPDTTELGPFNPTRHQYPEAANYAPSGYQLINIGVSNSRATSDGGCGGDDDYAYGPVFYYWGGEVWLDDDETAGLDIGSYAIENWGMWVVVYKPDEDEPWLEFEPHGTVFQYSQIARVSYEDCDLQGVPEEEMTIFYWNEETEEYEYIGGTVNTEEDYIEYDIDHFSRYVVASRY